MTVDGSFFNTAEHCMYVEFSIDQTKDSEEKKVQKPQDTQEIFKIKVVWIMLQLSVESQKDMKVLFSC